MSPRPVWTRLRGAQVYIGQYATAAEPDKWIIGYTGKKANCTFKELTPGVVYRFRVGAIFAGQDSPQAWSDISEHRAE